LDFVCQKEISAGFEWQVVMARAGQSARK